MKEELERQGISRHKLIQLSGVGRGVVYEWLKGTRSISAKNVERIMAALGLSITGGGE